eukprot:2437115-Rhodomonas_salina.1
MSNTRSGSSQHEGVGDSNSQRANLTAGNIHEAAPGITSVRSEREQRKSMHNHRTEEQQRLTQTLHNAFLCLKTGRMHRRGWASAANVAGEQESQIRSAHVWGTYVL